MFDKIQKLVASDPAIQQVLARVPTVKAEEEISVAGLSGSLKGLGIALLSQHLARPLCVVAKDKESAEKLRDDLQGIVGTSRVSLFGEQADHPGIGDRHRESVGNIETLRGLLMKEVSMVITYPGPLGTRLANPSSLRNMALLIEVGSERSFAKCVAQLRQFSFEKKDFVEAAGDFSVRGGILDVFPFVGENPIRIEFSGDVIESIREFDPISQRSIRSLSAATVVPDLLTIRSDNVEREDRSASLLDFLSSDAVIIVEEPDLVRKSLEEKHASAQDRLSWGELHEVLPVFPAVHLHSLPQTDHRGIEIGSLLQPSFNSSLKMLRRNLEDLISQGYNVFIMCETASELKRLKELIADVASDQENKDHDGRRSEHVDISGIEFIQSPLHEGFILPSCRLAVYTEHQIFNRLKRRGRQRKPKFRGLSEKEVFQMRRGDYVVHEDFGIGRFDGLQRIMVREVEQEVLRLLYESNDTLYVNLNYLHKVQKYASKEGHVPRLSRLGVPDWEKLKSRAKNRVKDIARDLINLYAQRRHQQGFSFSKDTLWQRELEASFIYEDTFDQAKTTREIKHDMEASFPMDRLVCGDVGFGKTEVAVRAAFKAVLSGKQVAVLVPTTILALQHFNTFLDRTARYSTNIQVISRLKTKKEQDAILQQLKTGGVDIIIGTHRLLSKDVSFKDLGLLMIDEEHRFGVSAKEKLRQLKANVDTLTLTATPIPRTLHFSLLGARDMSIIATPPRNRLPVITEIIQYNEDFVREIIQREIQRGGQVYFVHDRIHDIASVTSRLQSILPDVRFRFAHGQMHAHELENVMLHFLERRVDVLVSTKIIESGLDIPNVNTIIINRADRFGLAELYQLRGRVGRSNVQAYAYLITPPLSVLPKQTLQRLQAVEQFTDLGSGFNLAMRDLEIRGAGNLLGAEQSGFIDTMGFEMYTKILEEAVQELKQNEFREIFANAPLTQKTHNQSVVEAEMEVLIPDTYVEDDTERLTIYRRLYSLHTKEQVDELAEELEDRFGPVPVEVENLLNVVLIRLKASRLGFRKITITPNEIQADFPPDSDKDFYEGAKFQALMGRISEMREDGVLLKQIGVELRAVVPISLNSTLHKPLRAALDFLDTCLDSAVQSKA